MVRETRDSVALVKRTSDYTYLRDYKRTLAGPCRPWKFYLIPASVVGCHFIRFWAVDDWPADYGAMNGLAVRQQD